MNYESLPLTDKLPPRPRVNYSPEIAAAICERLAGGESLASICRDDGMPSRQSVLYWRRTDSEFSAMYDDARRDQAATLADEIVDTANSADGLDAAGVAAKRLQVETKKWVASKILPAVFGDKLEVSGKIDVAAQHLHALTQIIESEEDALPGPSGLKGLERQKSITDATVIDALHEPITPASYDDIFNNVG